MSREVYDAARAEAAADEQERRLWAQAIVQAMAMPATPGNTLVDAIVDWTERSVCRRIAAPRDRVQALARMAAHHASARFVETLVRYAREGNWPLHVAEGGAK